MSWTDDILAFLRQHASRGVREAPEAWVRQFIEFYDEQTCLGVAEREGRIVGVGMAVRTSRAALQEEQTWLQDEASGEVLCILEVCVTCPQALRDLFVMLRQRFPLWNRLPVVGMRRGRLKRFGVAKMARLYLRTFDQPEAVEKEVTYGCQHRIACPA